ncbi:hypothetical protein [Ascidiimonas aurantiaca]|uniref:hypothetical protein n=1 Tax=Ascidiimonas aurantiaca TaxID=1685432 RepID=UPI0030EC96C8
MLINYIYNYYPPGIENPFEDEYLSSEEYLTLRYCIDKARNWDMSNVFTSLQQILNECPGKKQKMLNLTDFDFYDRSFHIQYRFQSEGVLQAISVNISILLPVFCVYYLHTKNHNIPLKRSRIKYTSESEPYDFTKFPEEYRFFKKIIMKTLSGLGYLFIPNSKLGSKVPYIAYETIPIDKMTVFSALFMNAPYGVPR